MWTGQLKVAPYSIWEKPLRRKIPTTYFVNSMGDLFHEGMQPAWIDRAFAIMLLCRRHTFQILTKRAAEMQRYMSDIGTGLPGLSTVERIAHLLQDISPAALRAGWPPTNVHLGVSCERQEEADERIPFLLKTPAAVHFVSAEPLLSQIDLTGWFWGRAMPCADCPRDIDCDCGFWGRKILAGETPIDWVIVGGESGRRARPFDIAWAHSIIQQCRHAGVKVFMKQLGSNPWCDGRPMHARPKGKYGDPVQWPPELRVRELPTPHQGAPA